MVRFSVWLVNGYAHVFILLAVVILTFPTTNVRNVFLSAESNVRRVNIS